MVVFSLELLKYKKKGSELPTLLYYFLEIYFLTTTFSVDVAEPLETVT
jgi:hypothetical protein